MLCPLQLKVRLEKRAENVYFFLLKEEIFCPLKFWILVLISAFFSRGNNHLLIQDCLEEFESGDI